MGAEDAQMIVEAMASSGVEPTYCMGDDIPLAVLSDKPHMLYNYFKQRFAQVGGAACTFACCAAAPAATPRHAVPPPLGARAAATRPPPHPSSPGQVTNPPIDPLREGLVMSLEMRLGARGNLLQPGPEGYNQILLKSPVLLESELAAIQADTSLGVKTFGLSFEVRGSSGGWLAAWLAGGLAG
jgi:glutamate synthase (ferredoxin)